MAVYFEHQVQTGSSSAVHTDVRCHDFHNFLAVSSYSDENGGYVNLFNDEGQKLETNIPSEISTQTTSLAWHPTKPLLVVAWENGEVVSWNHENEEIFHPEVPHKAPVTVMLWSSIGSRLISADSNGTIVCWKLDSLAHLSMVFHHELKDAITQMVFRTISQPESVDIGGLARAAVSGDETALDLFSSWHRKDNRSFNVASSMERKENLNFFAGSVNGVIYYVNENGSSKDAIRLEVEIQQLLYHEDRDLLIIVTEDLVLYQFQVSSDGLLTEINKVKLIGKALEAFVTWAGKGVLVVATGDDSLRVWDVDMGDNYVLSLENNGIHDSTEIITSLAYCSKNCLLGCGTNRGNIIIWKYLNGSNAAIRNDSEKSWNLQTVSSIQGAIKHVRWGTSKNLLVVNTVKDIYILTEQIMSAHFKDQVSAVQISPTQLSIELFASKQHINFRTDLQIRGVYVTLDHIAVWNGKKVAIYEISSDSPRLVAMGAFSAPTSLVCIFDQSVYTAEDDKIHIRTFQGTIKQTLTYLENEGIPTCIEVCGSYLAVGTSAGVIKLWDLSRREAKLHANPKSMSDAVNEISSIVSAKCNCNGTKVSMIVVNQNQEINSKLFIWDVETDFLQYFNFESGKSEDDDINNNEMLADSELSFSERLRHQTAVDVCGRQPIAHFWDAEDPRQLLCEAVPLKLAQTTQKSNKLKNTEGIMAVFLFVTSENKIFVQETTLLNETAVKIIGIQVPHYYILSKEESSLQTPSTIYHKPEMDKAKQKQSISVVEKMLKDFVGLEDSDKKTRQAMTNFSYYLTIGNMDEAFKAIKTIKSGSVWENMAKMCVKTKRLDVASVCLGNMGFARGARALREASKEPELDARVAMLAIQLGMLDDAEKLYLSCGRYDLLNKLYQDSGAWHKALEIGEKFDRIHLRTMYYSFAKHLEMSGDIASAIPNYEKSDTHRFEVPRMLFDEPQALEEYISRSNDKALQKWWAQYMESTGEMETALQCYELAQDFLSLVRVYCYCNNLEKAAEIANETGDKAACYHLGRQYENHEFIKEAVHFYTRAQAYSNAIRLCKEHNLEDQLLNLALMGSSQELIDVARYYENKPDNQENAVMLYHKAGLYGKAIDLAFQLRHYSALHQIANELTEKTDPQLLQRCAQFFIENGQFERAVDLLAVAKKYIEALELCLGKNVMITEELAEKLSPSKDDGDNETRNKVLEKLAESCYEQGNYHLAAKKFTQAGNRIKAMKALLKSGDTEKITFFATVSRQKEIYVMAANYLQSLDWRREPEIMKNIIGFYTKGRALDLLAGFYEACAQVEVDEFQNYEKALGALNESYKCWMKITNRTSGQEQRLAQIQMKLEIIKKFIHARRIYEEDPAEAMKLSQALLSDSNLEIGVRRGDVYGFMIEYYAHQQNYKAAYNLLEEMQLRMSNVNFSYYINTKTVENVYKALDLPLNKLGLMMNNKDARSNASGDDEAGDEVEEAIPSEIYNAGDTYSP